MKISSKIKDYKVEVVDNIFLKTELIKKESQKYFFLIDENLYALYKEQINNFIADSPMVLIPAEENSKNLASLIPLYRKLFESGFRRNDILFTFGGGVLQDISGFIASTIFRGVQWVFIPTTLLAQADSCIGAKTSINFDSWKNQVGTFYPPDRIFIDTDFTATLKKSDFYSGLGEIIKVHLMKDMGAFELLSDYLSSKDLLRKQALTQMILSSLKIKKSYFADDELDKGRRNLLNYGHCFGHALESASNFKVSHGEAVLLGIAFANLLSLRRRLIRSSEFTKIEKVIRPYFRNFDFKPVSSGKIIEYLKKDKKITGNKLVMILLKSIGKPIKAEDIEEDEIRSVYDDFKERYAQNDLQH